MELVLSLLDVEATLQHSYYTSFIFTSSLFYTVYFCIPYLANISLVTDNQFIPDLIAFMQAYPIYPIYPFPPLASFFP